MMQKICQVVTPRWIGLLCAALSAAGLGVAVWSERALGLVPCPLCLWERWPYRGAVVLGVLAVVLPRRLARWMVWALVLVFLGGVLLSAVHVGVEFGWWKSPLPSCNAPDLAGLAGADDLFARLPARPAKPCDEPAYLLAGLPVSMAAMNLVFALGLGILAICGAIRKEPPRP